ncbi:MAG: tyrosine-type recombinase/integrase [Campylobacterota bacterium]|nr:tyrosine-type recombinase/integrase [Campylobacterota bacterium]
MKDLFFNYLEQFSSYLKDVKNYSPLTVKTYKTPIYEAIKIAELYEEDGVKIFDITKYRLKIATQNPKTINKKISSLKSFCKFLEDKDLNIKLKGASSVKSAQTLPKPIQTNNIFESLKDATLEEKLIILFIYSFGIRISELSTLKLSDISKNWITVTGKGDKQRQIPSNDTLNHFLNIYKNDFNPTLFLFEKEKKALSSRQLQYRLEKAFKNIGIKATPHQLRHSFASDLLNDGARINDISELLGHSSLKATGIYTKLNSNTKLKQYNMSHPLNKE